MHKVTVDVTFQTPCGVCIAGPTMSGKSTFTNALISNTDNFFTPTPQRIVYAYGDNLNRLPKTIELVQGLSKILDDDNYFDPDIGNLLIIDDLMEEISNDARAAALFTRGIHHRNVSVIFLIQNLFKQGKAMRDIALNSQYLILFKNKRDTQQIRYLAKQLGLKHFEKAYRKTTNEPFGYILIDLHPRSPDILRLQSHIFDHRRVYLENGVEGR